MKLNTFIKIIHIDYTQLGITYSITHTVSYYIQIPTKQQNLSDVDAQLLLHLSSKRLNKMLNVFSGCIIYLHYHYKHIYFEQSLKNAPDPVIGPPHE